MTKRPGYRASSVELRAVIAHMAVGLALAGAPCYSQTNIFPSSGNAGIGTTSPQAELDVNGNVHVNGLINAGGNYYNCVSWAGNQPPANGIKIITNIPYQAGAEMPTVIVEGYNYGAAKTIGITIAWYVYDASAGFQNPTATSFGSYTPQIELSNEGGYVVIFLNDKPYYARFSVRAYAKGVSEVPAWFENWSVADTVLAGSHTVTVPYDNGSGSFSGSVGVGTTGTPRQIFEVDASPATNEATPIAAITSTTVPATGKWSLAFGPYVNGYFATIGFDKIYNNIAAHTGDLFFATSPYNSSTYAPPAERVRITNAGFVGIGTATPCTTNAPANCILSVNGAIQAKEVVVNAGWPDYVFAPDYRLTPLAEVGEYIEQNHHLPGIPSAQQVQHEGIGVGEMQAKLLAKIEELTVHMIEADKRMNRLEDENRRLHGELERIGK
jgi:hypothetical protein